MGTKIYWKIKLIIWLNIIIWLFTLTAGIWIVFLIIAWKYSTRKLEIHDECILIRHWIITKTREEIPYTKINWVDSENTFWLAHLVIRTGNDKPTVFTYIEKHEEVISEIKKHISK